MAFSWILETTWILLRSSLRWTFILDRVYSSVQAGFLHCYKIKHLLQHPHSVQGKTFARLRFWRHWTPPAPSLWTALFTALPVPKVMLCRYKSLPLCHPICSISFYFPKLTEKRWCQMPVYGGKRAFDCYYRRMTASILLLTEMTEY